MKAEESVIHGCTQIQEWWETQKDIQKIFVEVITK